MAKAWIGPKHLVHENKLRHHAEQGQTFTPTEVIKYVDRPIEKIITKEITVPVEIIKEVIKYVDKPIEKIVEVTIPVEIVKEKIITQEVVKYIDKPAVTVYVNKEIKFIPKWALALIGLETVVITVLMLMR